MSSSAQSILANSGLPSSKNLDEEKRNKMKGFYENLMKKTGPAGNAPRQMNSQASNSRLA